MKGGVKGIITAVGGWPHFFWKRYKFLLTSPKFVVIYKIELILKPNSKSLGGEVNHAKS